MVSYPFGVHLLSVPCNTISKFTYVQILEALEKDAQNNPDFDYAKLTEAVKEDMANGFILPNQE